MLGGLGRTEYWPKSVTKPDDLPPGEHYAIFEYKFYTESYGPGDSSNYPMAVIYLHENRAAWEAEIESRTRKNPTFKWTAAILRVPSVTTKVSVDIEG